MASAFLTKEIVEQAVNMIRPGVLGLINREGKLVLYVVVLDPAAKSGQAPGKAVLWEAAIGEQNRKRWPRNYAQFALAKAELTLRTGLPAHLILRDAPHHYQKGDFKFGGSDIRNGIIVAASGLDWYHDYMVSGAVAAMCHGLVLAAAEKEYALDTHFIGET